MQTITLFHDAQIVKAAANENAVNTHNPDERAAIKEGFLDYYLDQMHTNNVAGMNTCPYSGGLLRGAWRAGYTAAMRCELLGRGVIGGEQ